MCGICGVINHDRSTPIDRTGLLAMRETLRHRGRDQAGVYISAGVGLGHRRLSIIDLRREGRQPMSNEDGTVWIVFNGEIYDFEEHRQWLIERGHRFRSRTDTEVIVHLYEELGAECLSKLRGMFAFAIWDESRRRLFAARDRLGMKPLFYAFDGSRMLFASEAKAILAYPGFVSKPEPRAIYQYLTLGYVPSPNAAFQGMSKLPPAHYLMFEDGRLRVERYWQLSYLPKLAISRQDACAEIRRLLEEAVKLRMMSDVPLGAFLSGGIDSSAVVAFMTRHSSAPVSTFSITFPQPEYDESRYSRLVASHFATNHHEFTVEPEEAGALLSELAWHYDEPYADSSAVPTYYLSKMTRQHVAVALNGDAGDENFAGYRRYSIGLLNYRLRHLPAAVRTMAGRSVAALYAAAGNNRRLARRLRLLGDILGADWQTCYMRMISYLPAAEKEQLYTDDFRARSVAPGEDCIAELFRTARADNVLDTILSVEVNSYLPEDLLVKVDRASMAFALEARSPMVDHRFMEFAARLPARYKMSFNRGKTILKQALSGILPRPVLERAKMGFGAPIDYWMRGQWKELLNDVLLSRRAIERGYFRPAAMRKVIQDHISGDHERQPELWALLMLEMWHRTFIDRSPAYQAN